MTDPLSLFSYSLAVLSPEPSRDPIEIVFVFRLPPGASLEVANYCGKLYAEGKVKRFGFVKSRAASGAESSEVFASELMSAGIPEYALVGVPYIYPENHINTYFESRSFAEYLKPKKNVLTGILGQPYHLLRGYLSYVSALEKAGYLPGEVGVYALPCPVGSWTSPVVHSQGVVTGTKWDIVKGEVDRIFRYQEKGDLIVIPRALKWIQKTMDSVLTSSA